MINITAFFRTLAYAEVMMDTLGEALISAGQFVKLVGQHSLHLRYNRILKPYAINGHGTYAAFRETVNYDKPKGKPVTLVVGFRLRLIGNSRIMHWLFQRVCILTTPFWSGFKGFSVKLWMTDPQTRNYLGIYDWAGRKNAQKYVDALVRVLKPLSTPDSVWYKIYPQEFEDYLQKHEAEAYTANRKAVLTA